MSRPLLLLALCALCAAPSPGLAAKPAPQAKATPPAVDAPAAIKALLAKHGEAHRVRIELGVAQVAALWRPEDGDLTAFALEQFIADPAALDASFARFELLVESLWGHLHVAARDLRRASDLEIGPLLPVDPLMAGYDPGAHALDDLFANKLAFVALLNFPVVPLDQRYGRGKELTRRQWAEARLTQLFAARVPAAVRQEMARAGADGDLYVSGYNIWMHHLVDGEGKRLFPSGLRLISHWNLRDELKAAYDDPEAGLARQRVIVKVMERIVTQTIPAAVIDNPRVDWNPFTNAVVAAPAATVEVDAPPPRKLGKDLGEREPDTRYAVLLGLFRAHKQADPYTPSAPDAVTREFEYGDVTEKQVVWLLTAVLDSRLAPRVGAVIEKRLGRPLEPGDLWYAGFRARGALSEAELDKRTRKRYPTAAAFAKDIPRILAALGFDKTQVKLLSAHIVVEASRGAGHAMEPGYRGDDAHLRTRVEKDGMNYKGYNIAVHELGHNVEQVFSTYRMDSPLMSEVPIIAITEALAFVFQHRDLELLGVAKPSKAEERERALATFWETWEIAGVALVEIRVWRWMYKHPKATPGELREATLEIAREVWNRWYAPILGGKDTAILAIYSHTLGSPPYLFNYPLGHLIAFQLEEHMAKLKPKQFGAEFERMVKIGRVTPDLWMEHATGSPLSAEPLLRATEAALAAKP